MHDAIPSRCTTDDGGQVGIAIDYRLTALDIPRSPGSPVNVTQKESVLAPIATVKTNAAFVSYYHLSKLLSSSAENIPLPSLNLIRFADRFFESTFERGEN